MLTDLTSSLICNLQNSSRVFQSHSLVPYNSINLSILACLKKHVLIQGFSALYEDKTFKSKKTCSPSKIQVKLAYDGLNFKKARILKIKRISKPGRRIYLSYNQVNKFVKMKTLNGGLVLILSSFGLITHLEAAKFKVGGELLLFYTL